jgi:hypothetical protein
MWFSGMVRGTRRPDHAFVARDLFGPLEASMLFRAIIPALVAVALAGGAALAQTADSSPSADLARDVPQKIHDELTAQGFKDVKVMPGSFIVSAKNKADQPVMMLIGPGGMTVLTGNPDQAQSKDSDDKDEIIQQ